MDQFSIFISLWLGFGRVVTPNASFPGQILVFGAQNGTFASVWTMVAGSMGTFEHGSQLLQLGADGSCALGHVWGTFENPDPPSQATLAHILCGGEHFGNVYFQHGKFLAHTTAPTRVAPSCMTLEQ